MDKSIAYVITLVVCILLQLAIAPVVAIAGAQPNFLLICVLLIASRSGATAGSVAGFLLGLFYDFAGDGIIGAMALAFTLTALVVGLLCSGLLCSAMDMSPAAGALVGLVFGVLTTVVYGLVTILGSTASGGAASTMFSFALPSGIYTAVLCALAMLTMGFVIANDTPQMGSRFGGGNSMFR